MAEAAIARAVHRVVERRGGWIVPQTGVALAGAPDRIGSYRGRCLAWEIKTPAGRLRPAQRVQLMLAARAGADAAVVRSAAEAAARLDAIDAELDVMGSTDVMEGLVMKLAAEGASDGR